MARFCYAHPVRYRGCHAVYWCVPHEKHTCLGALASPTTTQAMPPEIAPVEPVKAPESITTAQLAQKLLARRKAGSTEAPQPSASTAQPQEDRSLTSESPSTVPSEDLTPAPAPGAGEEARATPSQIDAEVLEAIQAANLNPPIQDMVKRIAKVTAARKEEELRRMQLEQQVEELRSKLENPGQKPQDPELIQQERQPVPKQGLFDAHPAMARVTEHMQQVESIIRWARENPDGGALPDGSDHPTEYTASQVEAILLNAMDQRTDLRADRRVLETRLKEEAVRKADEEHGKALQVYPWMADQESSEFRVATQLVTQLGVTPEVQFRMPDWRMLIGDLVTGRMAREGKASPRTPAAAINPRRVPADTEPTRQPGAPTGQRRRSAEEAVLEETDARFATTGSTRDLAQKLAARRRARQASA